MTWQGWLALGLLCLAPAAAVAGILVAARREVRRRMNLERYVSPAWLRRAHGKEDGTWPS